MDDHFILTGPSVKDRVLALVANIKSGELTGDMRDTLEETDPFLIERVENELLDEGVSRDDIMLLCDARSEAFTAAEEIDETFLERPGHPIHTLMEEHRQILLFMTSVRAAARELRTGEQGTGGTKVDLSEVEPFLKEAQKHFEREENVLFPYLEKHGIEVFDFSHIRGWSILGDRFILHGNEHPSPEAHRLYADLLAYEIKKRGILSKLSN